MIRKLLTTTALIAVMTGGTYAAQHDQMTKSDGVGVMVFTTDSMPSETSSTGYHEAQSGQILASTLIGQTVYNVHAGDAETDSPESIGEVDDVVMGPNGGAQAVVISVGGFLGIGEKDVAVDYQRLQWINRDGENWLAIEATSEELEAAPAFEHAALENGMDGRATMGSDTATMDGDTARVDSDTAMKTNAGEAAIDSDSAMPTSRRDALKVVDRGSLSAENLLGTTVYGANEENVGEIGDIIVSQDGNLEAYIIDVGGFLGLGEKPIALDASQVEVMQDENGSMYIFTSFTEEQLENQTAYSEEAWKTDRDAILIR